MHDVACELACAVRMRSSNGREGPLSDKVCSVNPSNQNISLAECLETNMV